MHIEFFLKLVATITALTLAQNVSAELHSRLAGEAWYDDKLNITWLTDANLAASETFGAFNVEDDGSMKFSNLTNPIGFIVKMNEANYLGFNDWRAPSTRPIDGVSFNHACSNNGSTDRCYSGSWGWLDVSNKPTSELGHMYYVNLGNLGWWVPNGDGSPWSHNIQPGFGLSNTGPFVNLLADSYWTSVSVDSNQAWDFVFINGGQRVGLKRNLKFVWPVRDGDIPDSDGPSVGIGFAPAPVNVGQNGALTATANEANTGGAWVESTEYQLDDGEWLSMDALDGNYDSMQETGTTLVSFNTQGTHQVCVRATDQPGNTSDPICMDVEVEEANLPPLVLVFKLIPDTPVLQGLLLELQALATDVNRGGRVIQGAEYRLDSLSWTPMIAFDGAFDSELEQIQGFVDTSTLGIGTHTVCVRATEVGGAISVEVCDDFEIGLVSAQDDYMVRCIHDPLWPKAGETVQISMETLKLPADDSGTPFAVERTEIWFEDNTAPARQQEQSGIWSLEFTTPKLFHGSFTYGCRAKRGNKAVFTGWRTVTVGSLPEDKPIPVIFTGPSSERIDYVFIADEDSYTGPDDPDFLDNVKDIILDGIYGYELFNNHQHQFNFWVSRNTGDADGYNATDGCQLTKPSDWNENYAFADVGAVLHTDEFRDCAKSGLFSSDWYFFPTFRHESGHDPFGLADEYCCDGGYWEDDHLPNNYKTLESCEADAPNLGKQAADCREWESTRNDKTYYATDPRLNDLMSDRGDPNEADLRRIEWKLQKCGEGEC